MIISRSRFDIAASRLRVEWFNDGCLAVSRSKRAIGAWCVKPCKAFVSISACRATWRCPLFKHPCLQARKLLMGRIWEGLAHTDLMSWSSCHDLLEWEHTQMIRFIAKVLWITKCSQWQTALSGGSPGIPSSAPRRATRPRNQKGQWQKGTRSSHC
jgi:hypothetical protein